jgi:hypothetical protein
VTSFLPSMFAVRPRPKDVLLLQPEFSWVSMVTVRSLHNVRGSIQERRVTVPVPPEMSMLSLQLLSRESATAFERVYADQVSMVYLSPRTFDRYQGR